LTVRISPNTFSPIPTRRDAMAKHRTQAEIKAAALEAVELVKNGATVTAASEAVGLYKAGVSVALALSGVEVRSSRLGHISFRMEKALDAVEAGVGAEDAARQAGVGVKSLYIAIGRRAAARISGAA
jgi:hypothetical protein